MKDSELKDFNMPDDLRKCVEFHGHLCPGLVYGYRVAKAAMNLLEIRRSRDEEVVAVSENDSCAVDALQVLLGTSAGKGNLILKDYGKNAYTVLNRKSKTAYRFSRKKKYRYESQSIDEKDEFVRLDAAISSGTATEAEKRRHKMLKSQDLLRRSFDDIFSTEKIDHVMPPYAPLARSEACAKCGEMTMSTKMIQTENGEYLCKPCAS
jgi:formylmethanofuran dehydrogenase subunit E